MNQEIRKLENTPAMRALATRALFGLAGRTGPPRDGLRVVWDDDA